MGLALAGFIFLLSFIHLFWMARGKGSQIYGPLIVGFAIRCLLAFCNLRLFRLPGSGRDDMSFQADAEYLGMRTFEHFVSLFQTGKNLYSWVIGLFYQMSAPEVLIPIVLNIWSGIIVIYLTCRISHTVWGNTNTAITAAWLVAIFPTNSIYSALVLRENFVMMTFLLGVWALFRWQVDGRSSRILIAASGFLAAVLFHTGMLVCLPVMMLVLVQRQPWMRKDSTATIWIKRGAAILVGLAFVGYVVGTGQGMEKVKSIGDDGLVEAVAGKQSSTDQDNRATYLSEMQPESLLDLIWQTPIRMIYFVYTPFPWMVRSGLDIFGLGIAFFSVYITWTVIKYHKTIFRNPSARTGLILMVTLIALFSVGTSNYGTAIRHRAKLVPLACVIIPTFPLIQRRRKESPGLFPSVRLSRRASRSER